MKFLSNYHYHFIYTEKGHDYDHESGLSLILEDWLLYRTFTKRISTNNSWYFEKCWLLIKIWEKKNFDFYSLKDHSEGCRLLKDSYYLRFLTSPLIHSLRQVTH